MPEETRGILQQIHTYASEYVPTQFYQNYWPVLTFLRALGVQGGQAGDIAAPDTGAIIGGMPTLAMLESINGSTTAMPRFKFKDSTQVKNIAGRGDTSPSMAGTSQLDDYKSASFAWTTKMAAVSVPKSYIDAAKGGYAKQSEDLLNRSINDALQTMTHDLATELITGTVANQAVLPWPNQVGILDAVDDANTYGAINRGLAENVEWRSPVEAGATPASLDLVDQANIDLRCGEFGTGVNMIIMDRVSYRKVKQEARADMGVIKLAGVPQRGESGFIQQAFEHDGVIYVYDPRFPHDDGGTAVALTAGAIRFEVDPAYNMRVTGLDDPVEDGRQGTTLDVSTNILFKYRMYVTNPKTCAKWTNLT